jgi:uncharacterized damage-inducible protein DinB
VDLQKEIQAEFGREVTTTRKMLEAIPADADLTWKSNPKSMSLGRLAAHTAETAGEWAISSLSQEGWDLATGHKPWVPSNKAEVLATFDKDTTTAKQILASFPMAKWDEHWKLRSGDQVYFDQPRYIIFRTWVLNHMIHHRAQLGRDLRSLGVPIPGTYGPSADEG